MMHQHTLPPLSLQQARIALAQQLQALHEPTEAQALARWAMLYATQYEPTQLLLHGSQPISAEQQQRLQHIGEQLMQHRPLQYVVGEAFFCGLRLEVSPAVLIPRPETEELVQLLYSAAQQQHPPPQPLLVLDIGTGSGCIAIAVQQLLPRARLTAIDISPAALAVAQRNAQLHHQSIQWIHADIGNADHHSLFAAQYHIIVSNPPYISPAELPSLAPHVLLHEPHLALFAPEHDVLFFYRHIMAFAQQHLYPKAWLWLELHADHAADTAALAPQYGLSNAQIHHDLSGKARFLSAQYLP